MDKEKQVPALYSGRWRRLALPALFFLAVICIILFVHFLCLALFFLLLAHLDILLFERWPLVFLMPDGTHILRILYHSI